MSEKKENLVFRKRIEIPLIKEEFKKNRFDFSTIEEKTNKFLLVEDRKTKEKTQVSLFEIENYLSELSAKIFNNDNLKECSVFPNSFYNFIIDDNGKFWLKLCDSSESDEDKDYKGYDYDDFKIDIKIEDLFSLYTLQTKVAQEINLLTSTYIGVLEDSIEDLIYK